MTGRVTIIAAFAVLATVVPSAFGQTTIQATFNSSDCLAGWTTSGDVSIDTAKGRDGTGGALKIGPGGKAVLTFQENPQAGTITFWVYEDTTSVAKPKGGHNYGALYGVGQGKGKPALVAGSIYAAYLAGDKTYSLGDFTPGTSEMPSHKVSYLGLKRTEGWHKWTFKMDPEKGLTVLHNDKSVGRRFNWNKTRLAGMNQIVLFGDKAAGKQVIWIDDVSVTAGAVMKSKPTPPPPPPPATPEKDPAPAKPVELVKALRGVHPRLLFTAADIPAMRAKLKSGYGKSLYDRMLAYVPSSKKPNHTNFLRDATDGQRQGFWRLPTVALHYVLTGDKTSFDRTVAFMKFLMELEHWETHELDSGMSSANIMIGAALAYDWLYNDLDPAFRAAYRDKLLLMARRQYYHGHLMKIGGVHYWQGDPANNHRFHRNAGMALAILAAAEEGKTDDDWLLAKTLEELQFIVKWLPEDGTCHESPTYAVFGNTHLMLAIDAAQRCYGVPLMDHPFFRTAALYKIQTMRPDLRGVFGYGDSGSGTGSGTGGYHSYLHCLTAYHKLADAQAAIAEMDRRNKTFYAFTWFSVIWWQPLEGGSIDKLPKHVFFPDLGLSYCRTGWQASDVGAMFKCGPFGGYELNKYRNQNGLKYVNVAHDDPDANSFQIFTGGAMVAETDGYSKHKKSANHNTILINGAGQVVAGRPEGGGWSQPGGDMSEMAVVTSYARKGNNVAVDGEAAGSYLANPRKGPKRPALDRYRRTFLWVEDKYILVLDDIRAPKAVDVAWLMQSGNVKVADAAGHRYVLTKGEASCSFQVAATEAVTAEVVLSSAGARGKALGWKQLQLKARTSAIRLVSVYDAWHKGDLSVKLSTDGADRATVTVTGSGINDTWGWTAAQGRLGPSKVVGTTANGAEIITMDQREPETVKLLEAIRALDNQDKKAPGAKVSASD
jgi:hypothetical protein